MSREVVVVSGVRTAIGTYGGSLKDIPPTDLAAQVVRESLARAGVDGKDVGHVVFGHVVNTEPKDMYLSRVAAINGGCAEGTPPLTSTACAARACRPSSRPASPSCSATRTSPSGAVPKT
jgi:acetyl-CoA acetyltransferase